ncbi:MAG: class I SAM-dependent methyltransferase [Chlorobi bacterium]|nr:class I SAM-dependent methyltransferase [Chlorobiota bacterium]
MEEVFYEMFNDLPRLGPGEKNSTIKAFRSMTDLSSKPKILDIGCGVGTQTFHIAEISDGDITATDNFQDFLDIITKRAKNEGFSGRVRAEIADMTDLKYPDEKFDLLWSESSIYNIGFESGLREWKRLLKPGGYIVVSEAAWKQENPPKEIYDWWQSEYPAITTDKNNRKMIEECGYELIDSFALPDSAWMNDYYTPMQANIDKMMIKYAGNKSAVEIIRGFQYEIDLFKRYSDFYGYYFFIMRKP